PCAQRLAGPPQPSSTIRVVISGLPGSAAGRGALGRIGSSRISGSNSRRVASRWPRFATIAPSSARLCFDQPRQLGPLAYQRADRERVALAHSPSLPLVVGRG